MCVRVCVCVRVRVCVCVCMCVYVVGLIASLSFLVWYHILVLRCGMLNKMVLVSVYVCVRACVCVCIYERLRFDRN